MSRTTISKGGQIQVPAAVRRRCSRAADSRPLTVGVFTFRHVGRGRRGWTRADIVALPAHVALVLVLGGWVMLPPAP